MKRGGKKSPSRPRRRPKSVGSAVSAGRIATLEAEARKLRAALAHERKDRKAQETAWSKAQRELEIAQDSQDGLYETAPISLVILDRNGFIREANLTATQLLGKPRAKLIGTSLARLVAAEDRLKLSQHLEDCQRSLNQHPLTTQLRIEGAGGLQLDIELLSTSNAPGHRPTASKRFRTTLRDITAQKQGEAALRASEEQYRLLFELSPNPMWIFDEATLKFLAVNHATVKLYGWSHAEFLRMTVAEIRPPEELPKLLLKLAPQRESQRPFTSAWRHWKKDHTLLEVEVNISCIQFHGRDARLVTVHDITERVRALETLHRSEQRLSAFVVASSEVLYRMSPDWREMRQLQSRGFLMDTEVPSASWIREYIHPDDQPRVKEAIQRAIRTKGVFELEHRIRRADGTLGWTFSRAVPLLNERGDVVEWFGAASDITERKRTEEALRESEERLRQGVQVAGLGLFHHDHQTDQVRVSAMLRTIQGWPEDSPATLKHFAECVHPEDRPAFIKAAQRAHDPKGDGRFVTEHRIVRPDGTVRWVSARSQTTFSGRGSKRRPLRTVGALVDITESKEAQMQLIARERRFRALTEKASEDIILLNAEGQIIYESPHETPLLGFQPGEMTGRSGFELVHPEDLAPVQQTFAGLLRNPRSSIKGEFRMRRKEGGWSWIHYYATNLLHDPAVGAVVLNLHNITERKQAEEALHYHYNLIQSIAENIATSIFVTDEAGRITFVNPEAERTFGFAREALLGKRLHDQLHHHHPDGRVFPVEDCPLARIFSSGESVRNHEAVFFHKTGDQVEVSCSNSRLVVDGKWVGTVIVVHDITARKAAENALRQARDELEARVAERTSDLAKVNLQLTQEIAERAKTGRELQRQTALLSMVSDAVIIWRIGGGIRYWNHGAKSLYGFSAEETLDRLPQALLKTVFPKGVEAYLAELAKAGSWQGELIHQTKTGQYVRVESHHQLLKRPDGTGLVLETNHDITQRVALEEAVVGAGERERERLGQDLHDGLCQLLTAARLKSDSLVARLAAGSASELSTARTALNLVTQALDEARRLARGLEPVEPVPEGLTVALQNLAATLHDSFNVACACKIPIPVLIPDPKMAAELFRIAQEATNNAIKHSHAQSISIRLMETSDGITLTVSCDGKAFPSKPSTRGTGLKTMRFRARRIGATLEVGPGPSGGAVVRCVIPKPSGEQTSGSLDILNSKHQMMLSSLRSDSDTRKIREPSKAKPS